MSNFSSLRPLLHSLQSLAVFILVCVSLIFSKSLVVLSDANAQTPQQIEMARQLGIDIEALQNAPLQQDRIIGQQYENFELVTPEKDEKEDLSQYLGFSKDLERFGEKLFNSNRDEFKIADDSQAPENYILGLGDEIIVQYYGAESDEFILVIDRSGSVLLPKIGPVILNGLNLEEAKKLIRSRVKTQLVGVNATITVGKTRFINIFVAGNVVSPGIYSMPALSRVTHALYTAGGISELGTYRDIQIKRQGKLVGKVDLYDFLVYGDNSSDINLHPNDVILVGVAKTNIQVSGAVKRSGIYELLGNEDSEMLIEIFGGLSPGADSENVSYTSLIAETGTQLLNFEKNQTFNFFDGDSIFIKFKPTAFQKVNNVTKIKQVSSAIRVSIQGKVNYPGTYLLQSGERISGLLERAGGFTQDAFMEGAVFTRASVRNQEAYRARELAGEVRRQVVSSAQTQSKNKLKTKDVEFITEQLESYTGIGRVVIDMPRAMSGRKDSDLVLSDGDSIFIPAVSNTVTVFGEVRRQSSFVYNKSYALEDYLTMAAGATQLADEENIYIVKANGNIELPSGGWFKFGSSKIIDNGDTIIVPVDYQYRQSLPFWRDVISIVYQGAVAVAAINGL